MNNEISEIICLGYLSMYTGNIISNQIFPMSHQNYFRQVGQIIKQCLIIKQVITFITLHIVL